MDGHKDVPARIRVLRVSDLGQPGGSQGGDHANRSWPMLFSRPVRPPISVTYADVTRTADATRCEGRLYLAGAALSSAGVSMACITALMSPLELANTLAICAIRSGPASSRSRQCSSLPDTNVAVLEWLAPIPISARRVVGADTAGAAAGGIDITEDAGAAESAGTDTACAVPGSFFPTGEARQEPRDAKRFGWFIQAPVWHRGARSASDVTSGAAARCGGVRRDGDKEARVNVTVQSRA